MKKTFFLIILFSFTKVTLQASENWDKPVQPENPTLSFNDLVPLFEAALVLLDVLDSPYSYMGRAPLYTPLVLPSSSSQSLFQNLPGTYVKANGKEGHLLLENGQRISFSCKKNLDAGRTRFIESKGKKYTLASRNFWIEMLPAHALVVVPRAVTQTSLNATVVPVLSVTELHQPDAESQSSSTLSSVSKFKAKEQYFVTFISNPRLSEDLSHLDDVSFLEAIHGFEFMKICGFTSGQHNFPDQSHQASHNVTRFMALLSRIDSFRTRFMNTLDNIDFQGVVKREKLKVSVDEYVEMKRLFAIQDCDLPTGKACELSPTFYLFDNLVFARKATQYRQKEETFSFSKIIDIPQKSTSSMESLDDELSATSTPSSLQALTIRDYEDVKRFCLKRERYIKEIIAYISTPQYTLEVPPPHLVNKRAEIKELLLGNRDLSDIRVLCHRVWIDQLNMSNPEMIDGITLMNYLSTCNSSISKVTKAVFSEILHHLSVERGDEILKAHWALEDAACDEVSSSHDVVTPLMLPTGVGVLLTDDEIKAALTQDVYSLVLLKDMFDPSKRRELGERTSIEGDVRNLLQLFSGRFDLSEFNKSGSKYKIQCNVTKNVWGTHVKHGGSNYVLDPAAILDLAKLLSDSCGITLDRLNQLFPSE